MTQPPADGRTSCSAPKHPSRPHQRSPPTPGRRTVSTSTGTGVLRAFVPRALGAARSPVPPTHTLRPTPLLWRSGSGAAAGVPPGLAVVGGGQWSVVVVVLLVVMMMVMVVAVVNGGCRGGNFPTKGLVYVTGLPQQPKDLSVASAPDAR